MSDKKQVNKSIIRLVIGDITAMEVESFVFYAEDDLKLGSGFGGAITVRGGPSIQKQLDGLAPVNVGDAVITEAGELKAKFIIHADGPKFQEENLEKKLRTTVESTLKAAEDKGISQVAFPPMGTGFYGVPLATSAEITLETVKNHLNKNTGIKEVIFCMLDNREFKPFQAQLQGLK